jgi:phage shock protein PspC (stress-responsive transcriptional regulator)
MGMPEEFEADVTDAPSGSGASGAGRGSSTTDSGKRRSAIKPGKRLFRDEEDKVVSGVCSGIAAYFGIQDPVWIRLAFVLLTFISGGFWVVSYIILSVVVPAAKTAADRLAMRGEPINVDSIAQEIEAGFNRLGSQVNEFGESINKSSARNTGRAAMANGLSVLGQIFAMMLKFIGKFGLVILFFIAVVLFLALAASWVGGVFGLVTAAPYISYFSPFSNAGNWLGFTNGFFLLGIPVVGLILTFSRVLLKTRPPRWLGPSLGLLWFFNLASAVGLGISGSRAFRQSSTLIQSVDLSGINSDTLYVVSSNSDLNVNDLNVDGSGIRLGDGRLDFRGMADVRVKRSETGRFLCSQTLTARGATSGEAAQNAAETNFNVSVNGNQLFIPAGYSIAEGKKWRVQKVRVNLEIPNGKCVVFDENIYERAAADVELYSDDNDRNYISKRPGRVFRMTEDGLVCTDCPKFGDKEYRSERNYEDFIVEGNFTTEIRKSDEDGFYYSIEGQGSENVKVIKTGNSITVTSNGKPADKVTVILNAQVFTSLIADNAGLINIRGFEEGRASITAKGSSKVKASFDVSELTVTASGPAVVELSGDGDHLKAILSKGANLDASAFHLERAEVAASDNSHAHISANDRVESDKDGTSTVKVTGGAREQD